MSRRRVTYTLLAVAVVIMAGLAALVRWLEPRMAFFPFTGEDATPRDFGVTFEAVTLATSDGEKLRAWRMPAETPRARIVYFQRRQPLQLGAHTGRHRPARLLRVRDRLSRLRNEYRASERTRTLS